MYLGRQGHNTLVLCTSFNTNDSLINIFVFNSKAVKEGESLRYNSEGRRESNILAFIEFTFSCGNSDVFKINKQYIYYVRQ